MMKVFMNEEGHYLRFWRAEIGGFVAGSHWVYQWSSLNSATLAERIPCGRGDKWRGARNPKMEVIAEFIATEVKTRTVTLIKAEDHE